MDSRTVLRRRTTLRWRAANVLPNNQSSEPSRALQPFEDFFLVPFRISQRRTFRGDYLEAFSGFLEPGAGDGDQG